MAESRCAEAERIEEDAAYYEAFSQLYALLSAGLRRPDRALAEALVSGSYVRALSDRVRLMSDGALREAVALLKRSEADAAHADPEALRLGREVEYNRLFVGPDTVPVAPYESWFVADERGERQLMSSVAFGVQRSYREAGMALDEAYRDLPDHLATELRFVADLAARAARNPSGAAEDDALIDAFLEQHLARWAGAFSAAVQRESSNPFYQGLAAFTAALVELSR